MAEIRHVFSSIVFLVILTEIFAPTQYYIDEVCRQTFDIPDSVSLRITQNDTILDNLDCTVVFQSSSNRTIVFIKHYDTLTSTNDTCYQNILNIYNGGQENASETITGLQGLCGNKPTNAVFNSTLPDITFNFRTYNQSQNGSFEIIITSTHDSPCIAQEFLCSNGQCVNITCRCDGNNNCGDESDEDGCGSSSSVDASFTIWDYIALVIGILFVIIIFASFLVCHLSKRHIYAPV